jgi:hypothetical protein
LDIAQAAAPKLYFIYVPRGANSGPNTGVSVERERINVNKCIFLWLRLDVRTSGRACAPVSLGEKVASCVSCLERSQRSGGSQT